MTEVLDKKQLCSLRRRIGIWMYDITLVLSLIVTYTFICVIFNQGAPFPPSSFFYQAGIYGVTAVFYVYFWSICGQTLGMRAWNVTLTTSSLQHPSLLQILLRFIFALIFNLSGLTVVALFVDHRFTIYDRITNTYLRHLSTNSLKAM